MIQHELITQIDNFKERYNNPEVSELLIQYQNLNLDNETLNRAKQYLIEGIDIYKKTNNYPLSVSKISDSLKILPSSAGFFNRGTIHWCEHNYSDSFKDQCSALILDRDSYPLVYFNLANSLYELANSFGNPHTKNDKYIFDFIIQILKEGRIRNEPNAIQMLNHLMKYNIENV